ncbi:hypothetical protein ANN_24954 [Periplaneta americana]|uniref:Uncharacterized protein n=1 Tax=Periplaneta americana TaxID=6978 RepID=A0ABQ8S008_PERAM|nr:hypothetical protein ANN_24954 [Periplaneta americana]
MMNNKMFYEEFKVCHGSLYAVMWLADEPREFNLPTLPQRRITYVPEKLPGKYGVHSEEYVPIRMSKRKSEASDIYFWQRFEKFNICQVLTAVAAAAVAVVVGSKKAKKCVLPSYLEHSYMVSRETYATRRSETNTSGTEFDSTERTGTASHGNMELGASYFRYRDIFQDCGAEAGSPPYHDLCENTGYYATVIDMFTARSPITPLRLNSHGRQLYDYFAVMCGCAVGGKELVLNYMKIDDAYSHGPQTEVIVDVCCCETSVSQTAQLQNCRCRWSSATHTGDTPTTRQLLPADIVSLETTDAFTPYPWKRQTPYLRQTLFFGNDRRFYTVSLETTDAFTPYLWKRQTIFTPYPWKRQTLLHRIFGNDRRFYTVSLETADAFTPYPWKRQTLLHRILETTDAFTPYPWKRQTLLHRILGNEDDRRNDRRFYTVSLETTDAFTPRFYTVSFETTDAFTPYPFVNNRRFYTVYLGNDRRFYTVSLKRNDRRFYTVSLETTDAFTLYPLKRQTLLHRIWKRQTLLHRKRQTLLHRILWKRQTLLHRILGNDRRFYTYPWKRILGSDRCVYTVSLETTDAFTPYPWKRQTLLHRILGNDRRVHTVTFEHQTYPYPWKRQTL